MFVIFVLFFSSFIFSLSLSHSISLIVKRGSSYSEKKAADFFPSCRHNHINVYQTIDDYYFLYEQFSIFRRYVCVSGKRECECRLKRCLCRCMIVVILLYNSSFIISFAPLRNRFLCIVFTFISIMKFNGAHNVDGNLNIVHVCAYCDW